MKTLATILLFGLVLAPAALAGGHDGPTISLKQCCDPPTRWADRWEREDVDMSITTEEGGVSLLLADGVVALQLSDRSMREVQRELRKERNEDEDNAFAQAIKSAVLSGVHSMLDHSLECRVRDLRSVEYRGGRLILTDRDGDRVFENIEVDDRQVLESFSERDARNFVEAFRRAKNRR